MALEFWLDPTPIAPGVGTPASLQLANGNVMVVWSANGTNGMRYAIFDPLAAAQGNGNLFPAATVPLFVYDLIPTADGGFDVVYRQDANGVSDLWLLHFNAGLTPSVPVRVAQDISTLTNLAAGAVALAGGGHAIVYSSKTGAPGFDFGNISLRIVDAQGNVGAEIAVNSTTAGRQIDARIATNGQNLFVTWWDEATQDVRGQMLTLAGARIGGEFLVPSTTVGDAGRPQIEVLPDGRYIVAWEAINADGADSQSGSARARLFNANGTPAAAEFVLNQNTTGYQGAPDITVLSDGTFFASWFDGQLGSFRWYNADGTPRSDALSTNFPGAQTSLVTIDDGRIAAFGIDANLSWLIIDAREGNFDGDEGNNQLVARRTGPTTINGFGGNDTFFGNDDSDTFNGGPGNDVFRSKLGRDTLTGGTGDDTYFFTAFSNTTQHLTTVVEASDGGTDTVHTFGFLTLPNNVEIGILYADAGVSSLTGNNIDNQLFGNSFANTLNGGQGNDTLVGASGADTLTGGAGNDVFRGTRAELNGDIVTDFTSSDRVHVTDASATGFLFRHVGTSVSFGGTSITLTGSAPLHLVAAAAAEGGVAIVSGSDAEANFTGDTRSDILWRNANGPVTFWSGTGNGFNGNTGFFTNVGTDWQVAATGDITGDAASDLLWRNASGALTYWASNGSGFNTNTGFFTSVGTDWQIAGLGNINGDNGADILWRNANGALTYWASTGTGFDGNTGFFASVGTDWQIESLADFNGDGFDDILWRNTNGALTHWRGNGSGFAGGQAVINVGTDWQVAGTGDFDGNGTQDILWRNANGALTVWDGTAGGFDTATGIFEVVGTDWSIVGTGDYTGDGRDDVLWRNANGALTYWASSGNAFNTATGYFTTVGTDWIIQDV